MLVPFLIIGAAFLLAVAVTCSCVGRHKFVNRAKAPTRRPSIELRELHEEAYLMPREEYVRQRNEVADRNVANRVGLRDVALRNFLLELYVAICLVAWNIVCVRVYGGWNSGHTNEGMILLGSNTALNMALYLCRAAGLVGFPRKGQWKFEGLSWSNALFGLIISCYLDIWALVAVATDIRNADESKRWSAGNNWSLGLSITTLIYSAGCLLWSAVAAYRKR
jgi:hypothetical protein